MAKPGNYSIFPNGNRSVRIDFGSLKFEDAYEQVISLQQAFQQLPLRGIEDMVPAYDSLTLYYDPEKLVTGLNHLTSLDLLTSEINSRIGSEGKTVANSQRTVQIPVCYDADLGVDLHAVANITNQHPNDIIRLHSEQTYHVYMIGFLPGFPYMGQLNSTLHLPRKENPVQVAAGSVAIAGVQTGIYPLHSPGGWYVLGRTPLVLFDKENSSPCLLKAGDIVQFTPITRHEYDRTISRPA